MVIIAISGKARHGKDTIAGFINQELVQHRYSTLIVHYADLLKHICKTFFGWNGEKDDYGRKILQYVGTDIIRKDNPNFWVDFMAYILKVFQCWDYVMIPDVRFPNEVDRLKEYGLDVIHLRVKRENFQSPLTEEQQHHPSEIALDNVQPDYLIKNDKDLNALKNSANKWVREELYERK